MKVGFDSYCYHRFSGEVYPDQKPPEKKMIRQDFLERAKELKAESVSLESCVSFQGWKNLARILRLNWMYKKDRVYAWGHPDGLERGQNEAAYEEMVGHIPNAVAIGADVMLAVGSSLMFRQKPQLLAIARCSHPRDGETGATRASLPSQRFDGR